MASSLGSLVVSLGLDAAQFVDGLTKSEYQARAFVRNVTATTTRMVGVFAAVGVAAGGALAVLGQAAGAIAKYQDLADQVGDTAEAVAGLQLAADLSGQGLDAVASASVKLTSALAKTDDESKGVGAALAAINVPLDEFKKLDPVAQLERVAGALSGFEDGAGKTAVAVALFGRAGAELIPFLNDLVETGGRNVRLTKDQIAAADEFAKKYERLKSEISGYVQVLTAEAMPVLVDLAQSTSSLVEQFGKLGIEISKLTGYTVAGFFDEVGLAAANAADFVATVAKEMGGLAKIARGVKELDWGVLKEGLGDAFGPAQTAISDEYLARRAARIGPPEPETKRPRLNFNAPDGKDGAAARKAQMDAELAAVKRFLAGLTSAYDSAESILEAQRAAGLAGEAEYYDAKRAFIQLNADAEVRALQAENARLAAEKVSGADRVKTLQQIADNEAEIERIRTSAAAGKEVLDIKQAAANVALVRSFEEARQAAQAYLDTLVKQQQRDLAGMGMGQRFRDRQAGAQQIDDRYQGQRDELANNRVLLELEGKWTSESQAQYDKRLQIIDEYHAKARESYDAFWVYRQRREADGLLGMQEAVRNYLAEAKNAYAQSAQAMDSILNTLEDGFAGVMDGNYKSFRDLADAMEREFMATINRMVAKALTAQLAKSLGLDQVGSGGAGGFGGFLASLFGGGGSGLPVSVVASAANPFGVAGLAGGGPVEAGGLYRVNERRTEMLSVNGRDYLMAGAAGRVRPNPQFAAAAEQRPTVQMTVYANDAESFRRSENQIVAGLGARLSRGSRVR